MGQNNSSFFNTYCPALVPPPAQDLTCALDSPYYTYSISELYEAANRINGSSIDPTQKNYADMLGCVQQRIIDANGDLNELLNVYETNKINSITASEMNNNTKTLYQTDLYFTYCKIFLFICLIGSYVYLFRTTGILIPIQNLIKNITEKATKMKDEIKIPNIKIPEVTMPTIKNHIFL